MTARSQTILARFPAHLEAPRAGKRLGDVTHAVAFDIDMLSAALARVRRARRLLDADEFRDLLRIAALHGITAGELAVLITRFDRGQQLAQAASGSATAGEDLIALWGIADVPPRMPRYPSADALVSAAGRALAHDVLLVAIRLRIGTICSNHAQGNGTVRALTQGAANALDLDVQSIAHSADRYLHAAVVRDRLRLTFPRQSNGTTVQQEFAPAQERMVIEENPLTPARTGDIGRKHAELFSVLRRGFEPATLQVLITGVENRTVGPMLVNRDVGRGLGFSGSVPSGKVLSFTEEGRVTLDGSDVTSMSYAWQGACFAERGALRPTDFVFDGPGVPANLRARFAVSVPTGALRADFAFPHSGESLPMPSIGIGETRFAFFVQQGNFSRLDPGPPERVQRVEPRPALGQFDQSVTAPTGPSVFELAPLTARPTAAVVSLAWHERAAFRVNVWIPRRFLALTPDDDQGRETLGRVALAVKRFRPAGVQVDIKFLDERWVLGQGIVLSEAGPTGETGPGTGTELWNAPRN